MGYGAGGYGVGGYGIGGYGVAAASPFLLFATNLLEAGAVTITSAATDKPVTRLYDRSRSVAWQATSNAVQDIDLDTVSASYSHVALVGFNGNTGVEIYRGDAFPPTTLVQAVTSVSGDVYITALGATYGNRYVRVRMLGGGATVSLAELFIGVPRILDLPPFISSAGRVTLGNVRRDVSPAGYAWTARRGAKRHRFTFAWNGITAADLVTIEDTYDDLQQGAKPLIIQDELGNGYWVHCVSQSLNPEPVGGGLYALPELAFEEAL
jgi:hypothetical protein